MTEVPGFYMISTFIIKELMVDHSVAHHISFTDYVEYSFILTRFIPIFSLMLSEDRT